MFLTLLAALGLVVLPSHLYADAEGTRTLTAIAERLLAAPRCSFRVDGAATSGATLSLDVALDRAAAGDVDVCLTAILSLGAATYPVVWANLGTTNYLTVQVPNHPIVAYAAEAPPARRATAPGQDGVARLLRGVARFARVEVRRPGLLEFLPPPGRPAAVLSRLLYDPATFLPEAWSIEHVARGTGLTLAFSGWRAEADLTLPLPAEAYVRPSGSTFTDLKAAFQRRAEGAVDDEPAAPPAAAAASVAPADVDAWVQGCRTGLDELRGKARALELYRLRWLQACDGAQRLKAGNLTPTVQHELNEAFGQLGTMVQTLQTARGKAQAPVQGLGAKLQSLRGRFRR